MKKSISLLLVAVMLLSCMSVSVFATEAETTPAETTAPETSAPDTSTPETTTPETSSPETDAPETTAPETSTPETTAPETTAPETAPPTEPEKEEVEEKVAHNITIAGYMMEQGLVMPNRRTAKEGEIVILKAFEKEYTIGDKNYKLEFRGWYSDAGVPLIHVNNTMAFFFMLDKDVVIYSVYKEVDMTEYYDWDSVEKKVDRLHKNEALEVDMEDESEIPMAVLEALAGKNADVTFTTADCIFTLNGEDVVLSDESDDGYSITYQDYELTKAQRRKVSNRDMMAIRVTVNTEHDVKAELRCFAEKDVKVGYLYRIDGFRLDYVAVVDVKNGEAIIPVSESGTYVLTSSILADVDVVVEADSANTVAIVGGKLVPLSAVVDGKLYFRPQTYGKLMFSEYTNTYYDVQRHKYKDQIDFVSARGLIDGVTADSFQPNAGITTGEFMRAIARLRGIPDKDAYDYCTQLDIFTYEYVEDQLLTRNEMAVIFTNFIHHLVEYPKSFGGYSMEGFDGNAAAWVGNRFRELKNDSPVEYDWKEYASRAEAAYLLEAAVRTVVTGK